jgi:archaellum biogenesis ATPase FlaH
MVQDAIIEGLRERVSTAIKANQSVGIQVPENRHNDLLEALFSFMCSTREDVWTYVTASNTFDYLYHTFPQISEHPNIKFIDCVSQAAGVSVPHKNCTYIESPTLLEKTILEIMNNFKDVREGVDKYIVIDSLSALVIYNDPEIIREFISLLKSRSRVEDIHLVSILIEEELDLNKLIQLNDKIVVLRDSFID